MVQPSKRPVAVVSACMTCDGAPHFALNVVEVTEEESQNGIHYYLVEADLLQAGYDEPYVHFLCGQDNYVAFRRIFQDLQAVCSSNAT
jgi:hypothetical protein